jgi:hypothetical protein
MFGFYSSILRLYASYGRKASLKHFLNFYQILPEHKMHAVQSSTECQTIECWSNDCLTIDVMTKIQNDCLQEKLINELMGNILL